MLKQKNRKNGLKVQRGFQLNYAVIIFLAITTAAIVAGTDLYIEIHSFTVRFLQDIPGADNYIKSLNQIMYGKLLVLLLMAAVISVILAWKFSSPVVKLQKNLIKILNGNLNTRLSFFGSKEFIYIVKLFNLMTLKLKNTVEKDRRIAEEVKLELDGLTGPDGDNKFNEKLINLKEKLDKINGDWNEEEKNS